ncbi:hypothetical protein GQ55_9G356800 [Panicum hallii var. hallii]|uniref:Uncharacterized protein n=1 Tax=Panicum hallii var. hallii TaxID=1504633 RepID=A0A2T7C8Q1_9POAL|nr:hypothetical protein GQ55_9G356800 [Panicum hallii var. hallii]
MVMSASYQPHLMWILALIIMSTCSKAMLLRFLVCAANHADHGYCHSCPFFVLWVFTGTRYAYVTRYSSENGRWELMASSPTPSDIAFRPSILVRNILYWPLKSKYILTVVVANVG